MNTRDSFTVANQGEEKQKSEAQLKKESDYQREQQKIANNRQEQNISQLDNKKTQNQLRDMQKSRDSKLASKRTSDNEQIKEAGNKAVKAEQQKRVQPRPKPPIGAVAPRIKPEDEIRTTVRRNMNKGFTKENNDLMQKQNHTIDEAIERAVKKEGKKLEVQNEQRQGRQSGRQQGRNSGRDR